MKILNTSEFNEKLGIKPISLSDLDSTQASEDKWYTDLKGKKMRALGPMVNQIYDCVVEVHPGMKFEIANKIDFEKLFKEVRKTKFDFNYVYAANKFSLKDTADFHMSKGKKNVSRDSLLKQISAYYAALENFGPVEQNSDKDCYEIVKVYHDILIDWGFDEEQLTRMFFE